MLILIVNAKIPEFRLPDKFPIFNGEYADFTVSWYRNVGTTLTIAMIMNIITPHIAENILYILPAISRCIDRGCTRDIRKTRQVLQEDYEEMYSGDEFLFEVRYAQILSAFFITMMFSAGIPSLYLVLIIQMVVLYWLDKRNFLTFMKKPPRYGIELSEMTRKLFQWALLVHLLFAFFMFSNVHIFSDAKTMLQERISKYNFSFIGTLFRSTIRLAQKHSQIYISFLIAIYVLFLFYKIAEYLYETFKENKKEDSRNFWRCELFKSIFLLCKRKNGENARISESQDKSDNAAHVGPV